MPYCGIAMNYNPAQTLRLRSVRSILRLFTISAIAIAGAASIHTAAASPGSEDEPAERDRAASYVPITGQVLAWNDGQLRPVRGATVSSGASVTETRADGSFSFDSVGPTASISVIRPGYEIASNPAGNGRVAFVLQPLTVRGIYVPFHSASDAAVQRYVRSLIDRKLINAVVLDVKEESGLVFDFTGTPQTARIGAQVPGSNIRNFLAELRAEDVYLIGRIVSFMDPTFAYAVPDAALHFTDGRLFTDDNGVAWSSAFSPIARQYNINIAVAAAPYFDEIQFDYLRLPYERGVVERDTASPAQRVDAVTTYIRDAAAALHLAGVAVSADTFGVIAFSVDDQGIGQRLEHLAPHLDYVSPMLYPSGWGPGWFGYAYPPAAAGDVIRQSTAGTLNIVTEWSGAHVRPWLQDFPDYMARRLAYGSDRVAEQIRAAAEAGANGFMLWDANLRYEAAALEQTTQLEWSPRTW